jgi:hypothetical protein
VWSDGALYANVVDTGGDVLAHEFSSSPGLIKPGVYYHVALTYDQASGVETLYLNGVMVAQENIGPITPLTSYDLYLGRRPLTVGETYEFTGELDEPALYNRALSAAELLAIYQAGSEGKCPPANQPVILESPASQTVVVGSNAVFTAVVQGAQPLICQWWFDGTNLLAGATNTTLTLNDVQSAAAGWYSMTVTNAYGSALSSNALLQVVTPGPIPQSPVLLSQPQSVSVAAGADVVFSVAADDASPLNYQWQWNGVNLPGATGNTLNLTGVTTTNAGLYDVIVGDNLGGRVASSNAVLTVILPPQMGTATAQVGDGYVVNASLTGGGGGYTNAPVVRLIGGGGSGAGARATISDGVVTGIIVTNAGSNYTSTPVVLIAPPVTPNPVLDIAAMSVLSFTNLTVGADYQPQRLAGWYWADQGPVLTATNPFYLQILSGTVAAGGYRLALTPVPAQALAVPQVVNGVVVSATLTSGGSGYLTAPTVSVVGGGGSNATAVATISGGVVTGLRITDAGAGYVRTPAVRIAAPPAVAVLPVVQPAVQLNASSLAPYENYQLQFSPGLGGAWANWSGGSFTPTTATNSQLILITNGTGYFRLQYLP